MNDIIAATRDYERWMAGFVPLRRASLRHKHALMSAGAFPFLRATFYRWMELWPRICPELNRAPRVLSVGDLHVENFGTWRDLEGRLVWGINDFDEAAPLPYTLDLVRLACSVRLAADAGELSMRPKSASRELLRGYQAAIESGGRPIVLSGEHPALRAIATHRLHDPEPYWRRLLALRALTPDHRMREQLLQKLPADAKPVRFVHRLAGLGSLGHSRLLVLAQWHGCWIAREIKQLGPSGVDWRPPGGGDKPAPVTAPIGGGYAAILTQAVRAADPFLSIEHGWLNRRLAPDCSRIELSSLPTERDERRLLAAMGFETGNVHAGDPRARKAILRDLAHRPDNWLHKAAGATEKAVRADYRAWKHRR